ncbi:bifunctional epoxide hydrolase 2 isoform X1 [Peromyscus californicus insignis]|uniref:bifunctional epoxide hydrolase 2 isoform X1 n=2 Tax=Peromyscus californicus insignis TaxID=564181 RepID=UPI0022A6C92D|nr:bifunctional epoxide hydrolase 2 isoform X1 [Peromyscus californicus insignis]XP_052588855.1 bifunctional epoxide hydrolase 2 isoform X1 [Peromyscus californicus insignis]
MALRVAAFDLDGVLALPSIAGALGRTEEALALPRGFLTNAFQKECPEGPNEQLMKGKITFSQWAPLMEESCRNHSKASGTSLPENFSISQIFSQAMAARSINRPMLQAAIALKKKGFTTCIITNNWLDDSDKRGSLAQMMCDLSQHFDFLIESCQVGMIKPEPQIYKFVLDTLKAKPNEIVFLDDFGSNLKPARDMGMFTILVRDTDTALRELEKVTGTQFPEAPLPVPCNPNNVSHGYVTVKPGIRLHFVEMGSGPVVCLCHGFPESWFSWRYQIPALAQAGFRVLAIDMKGYGDSSSPPEIEEYAMEVLCKEMVSFLDKLGIPQAVFIGHDWAGVLVWSMALFYPERVRAVASLNTPFMPPNPEVPPMEVIKSIPVFNYQLYFQEPGVAEAELEKNMSRTFKSFFRASDEMGSLTVHKATELGGILVNSSENPSLSRITTEEEIEFYVQQFKKSGFRGPLNWYRNVERNWKWSCKGLGRKILVPALMVTAEKDFVLRPQMSKNMENWIPYLKRGHIEDCGHWTQIEKPAEVNQILIKWLETEVKNSSLTSKI